MSLGKIDGNDTNSMVTTIGDRTQYANTNVVYNVADEELLGAVGGAEQDNVPESHDIIVDIDEHVQFERLLDAMEKTNTRYEYNSTYVTFRPLESEEQYRTKFDVEAQIRLLANNVNAIHTMNRQMVINMSRIAGIENLVRYDTIKIRKMAAWALLLMVAVFIGQIVTISLLERC